MATMTVALVLACSACALPDPNSAGAVSAAAAAQPDPPQPGDPAAAAAKPVDPIAPSSIPPVTRGDKQNRSRVKGAAGAFSAADPAKYSDGVALTVEGTRTGSESENGPGQFPGRSYTALSLTLDNRSAQPIDLNQVVVTATYGAPARIASPVYDDTSAQDFSGTVDAGGSSTATYLFAIPNEKKSNVVVTVDFDDTHLAATFSGGLK